MIPKVFNPKYTPAQMVAWENPTVLPEDCINQKYYWVQGFAVLGLTLNRGFE